MGKVKPFFGDIRTGVQRSKRTANLLSEHLFLDTSTCPPAGRALREALQARSYKQEVILMVSDRDRIDTFLQAANSMHRFGFGHILLLSMTESDCQAINNVVPEIGCGWTTFVYPHDFGPVYALWSLRYRTLARCDKLSLDALSVCTLLMQHVQSLAHLSQSILLVLTSLCTLALHMILTLCC